MEGTAADQRRRIRRHLGKGHELSGEADERGVAYENNEPVQWIHIDLAKTAPCEPGFPEIADRAVVGIYRPGQRRSYKDAGCKVPLEIRSLKEAGDTFHIPEHLLEHDWNIVNSYESHQVNALVGLLAEASPYQSEFSILETLEQR